MNVTAAHTPPDLGGRTPTRADLRTYALGIVRAALDAGLTDDEVCDRANSGGGGPARNGYPCYLYAYSGSYVWGGGERQWVKRGQLGVALGRDTAEHDGMAVFSISDLIAEARSGTQLDLFAGMAS